MRVQLLPSTFDSQGHATSEQRLTCFLIDERVAVDAGSLALGVSSEQRKSVRDIIITHPHMDHIASLPIFIDDLFETLESPVRVYATAEVISLLERDIFNWNVYPRFSGLKNDYGPVMEYVPVTAGEEFKIAHLTATAVAVKHIVPTIGVLISDARSTIAFSSDTCETDEFWNLINRAPHIEALLIEASFPDAMAELAEVSRHYTPASLQRDLGKLNHNGLDILAVHIKPAYRQKVIDELKALNHPGLGVMEPGKIYNW
jgi:ribonuclease BN (tRNA processing enzyme)